MVHESRSFEITIDIDTSPEEVWRALTDAGELTRWFSLDARVTPGPGGSVWISWGPEWEGASRIEIWEPNARLKTVQEQAGPFGLDSGMLKPGEPVMLAQDYQLEARGGRTRLRLVHSGFGMGAGWDEEFDGISRGWPFEMRSLRHYLTRHRGEDRQVAWARTTVSAPAGEVWGRLFGPGALIPGRFARDLREDDRYAIALGTGDRLSGTVLRNSPIDFAGTVDGMNDGLFRIGVDPHRGQSMVQLWLSAWNVDRAIVDGFRERTGERLRALFDSAVVAV
jgi:uncharacterized protein YndB with AHSA1/START domain